MTPCLGILKSPEIRLGAALTAAAVAKVRGGECKPGGHSVLSFASSSSIAKNNDDLAGNLFLPTSSASSSKIKLRGVIDYYFVLSEVVLSEIRHSGQNGLGETRERGSGSSCIQLVVKFLLS
ncbi:hypothetical protein Droror1_Dr00020908, partial [Drosera rotundifolia]